VFLLCVLPERENVNREESLDEDEVLNGDIYTQISPYVTANYWVRDLAGF